jgi:hypothetical protein
MGGIVFLILTLFASVFLEIKTNFELLYYYKIIEFNVSFILSELNLSYYCFLSEKLLSNCYLSSQVN